MRAPNFFRTLVGASFLACTVSADAEWVMQQSRYPNASFRAVHARSAELVWVGGSGGTCRRTEDGGKSWADCSVAGAEALDFRAGVALDERTAILASAGLAEQGRARIYRTQNGGKEWQTVYETAFAASNSSLVTRGRRNAWISSGGGDKARVCLTSNRGRNWRAVDTPMPAGATSGIFGLHFWNDRDGIGVGGDHQDFGKAATNVILTTDGGRTWGHSAATDPPGLKEATVMLRSGDLLAVGPSGTSISRDRGRSWLKVDSVPLHAASCAEGLCWAVGGKGTIASWQ